MIRRVATGRDLDGTDSIRGDFKSLKDLKVIPRFRTPVCPGADGGAASESSLRRHMCIALSRLSVRPGLRFSGSISNVLIYGGKAGCTGWGIAGEGGNRNWGASSPDGMDSWATP